MLSPSSVIIMICGCTVSAFSQILLKKSANIPHEGFWKQYLNKYVISGYTLMLISTLLAVWAYSGMSYKFGPPLESIGFIMITILSAVILKEKITKKKVLGVILIVVGIMIFAFGASD